MSPPPSIRDVRRFWEDNPVCAWEIPFEKGTPAYFDAFDRLRRRGEGPWVDRLYDFESARGQRVLDVGCGNGYVLARFAAAGASVTGVDITETAIDLSRRRFALAGLAGDFRVANAEELPFADATFDVVTSLGVLHHTPDTERAINEIFRVLKPGGRFFLMLYHRDSALYRFKFPILGLLTGKSRQQLVNEVDGAGNPKGAVYSRGEIRRLLHRFEVRETVAGSLQGWMLLPALGKHLPDAWFRPFERRWGWLLYASALKPLQSPDMRDPSRVHG